MIMMLGVALGLLAGLGLGLAGGFWWGIAQTYRFEDRLDHERESKDALLHQMGELTAKAVEPIQNAVVATVQAAVQAVVAPLGTKTHPAYFPEEVRREELHLGGQGWLQDRLDEIEAAELADRRLASETG